VYSRLKIPPDDNMLMIILLVGVRESTLLKMPPIPEISYAFVEVVRGQAGHRISDGTRS
jgi:hypothetical protein